MCSRFSLPSPIAALLLLIILIHPTFAQDAYLLNDTSITHRLDQNVEILIDKTDALTLTDILKPEHQKRFLKSGSNLTFGYLKPNLWLKVHTRTLNPGTKWLLELPAPFLEYVDFYQITNGQWKVSKAGYYRSQSLRDLPHNGHVLPLNFGTDLTSTVYIKISGSNPKTFPVYALEKERFYAKVRYQDLWYGLFFGILVVMFVYNLLLFLTLKLTNYLLYICTIVCTFVIFSAVSGYGGRFLWPELPMMNYYAGRLSLPVMVIFLTIFASRFLEVKRYSKSMYYILSSLIPLALMSFFLVATDTLSSAGNNLITISTVLYMATGVVCSIKGNKTGHYFVAAWTVYLIGGLLLTLRNSGVLPFNFVTTHFVEIGAATETMIIAFALGDRYRRYKQEKEEVQALALKVQQEATEKLENKVKERTEQLLRANGDLQEMLETNEHQTKVIERKNAELDSFFYRISHDLKGPITSLLGLTSIARLDIQDEKARDYIEKQHQQVERLKQIINGLINLTKLSHEELQREKIDFHKLIDDCIFSANSQRNYHLITFKKDIQPKIEFYCEWSLLNAVVQNLIENAVKYSGQDTPYVHIRVRAGEMNLVIEVEDNGQGIPLEHQARVFDMFYRANQSASGTGLGLYILKRSVERLNGEVDMRSAEKMGSVFTVKLPFHIQETLVRVASDRR